MKNRDLFPTPDEQTIAFEEHCNRHKLCVGCPHYAKRGVKCYFAWLDAEPDHMTNGQKYKTAAERSKAFLSFCAKHKCRTCNFKYVHNMLECCLYWLEAVVESEAKDEK